jgi:hypothetical protein
MEGSIMNINFNWTSINKEKPISDTECLVACYEGIDENGNEEYMYHVAKYFKEDEIIGLRPNKSIENKEQLLAKEEGFYIFSDASESYVELLDVVTAWVKL